MITTNENPNEDLQEAAKIILKSELITEEIESKDKDIHISGLFSMTSMSFTKDGFLKLTYECYDECEDNDLIVYRKYSFDKNSKTITIDKSSFHCDINRNNYFLTIKNVFTNAFNKQKLNSKKRECYLEGTITKSSNEDTVIKWEECKGYKKIPHRNIN